MRNILLLGIFSLAHIHFASAKSASRLSENLVFFQSSDVAAVSALQVATKLSDKYEHAGCILKTQQGYVATQPATSGSQDDFNIVCDLPETYTLVGIYHTHPVGSALGFSRQDIYIANELNVTSYIAFMDQKKIVKFIPGQTSVFCIGGGHYCPESKKTSHGDFVLKYN